MFSILFGFSRVRSFFFLLFCNYWVWTLGFILLILNLFSLWTLCVGFGSTQLGFGLLVKVEVLVLSEKVKI
jgi:hypothetical protein